MTEQIRQLTAEDLAYYKNMQTGLEEDYMLRAFHRITDGDHVLFGLFVSDQLVALSGFTLFKNHYAMLGRLRTDERYRKNGYGTRIVEYSLTKALEHPDVNWVGANTEKHNKAAQSLLKKVGLPPVKLFYAAQTDSIEALTSENTALWREITDMEKKEHWIRQTYLHPTFNKKVFPLEAYYPFPVSEELFKDTLDGWQFYENEDATRYVIMWEEFKGTNYLHVVYPWEDFMSQPGLMATIQVQLETVQQHDPATKIWWDFSETDAAKLPAEHPFDLPSPWILHGLSKEALLSDDVSESFERATALIEDVEEELKELEDILEKETQTLDSLKNQLSSHHGAD